VYHYCCTPLFSNPLSQTAISSKLPTHRMFNFIIKYKAPLQRSQEELGTNSHSIFMQIQYVLKFQRNLLPALKTETAAFIQNVSTYLPDYMVPHPTRLHSQCCENFRPHKLTHICFLHNYPLTRDSTPATLVPGKQCAMPLPTVTPVLPGW
jgi:hypothetical protein